MKFVVHASRNDDQHGHGNDTKRYAYGRKVTEGRPRGLPIHVDVPRPRSLPGTDNTEAGRKVIYHDFVITYFIGFNRYNIIIRIICGSRNPPIPANPAEKEPVKSFNQRIAAGSANLSSITTDLGN
jgi:hypothetical protein